MLELLSLGINIIGVNIQINNQKQTDANEFNCEEDAKNLMV